MDFFMSGKFIVGLILGAALYHLWLMKSQKSGA